MSEMQVFDKHLQKLTTARHALCMQSLRTANTEDVVDCVLSGQFGLDWTLHSQLMKIKYVFVLRIAESFGFV